MIKVPYKLLKSPQFQVALRKISNHPFKSQKSAYNVMRIAKKVDEESKNCQELFTKLLKGFAKLDDKGEFVPVDGQPGTYQVPDEKQADFQKAAEEFDELEFTIERYPIKLEELDGVGLSPAELGAVESLLQPEEETKGACLRAIESSN